jgi:dihydroxyacetone kinase
VSNTRSVSRAPTISNSRATGLFGRQATATHAQLGARAEQRAQAGGVAEVDPGEVDHEPLHAVGTGRVERRAQLRRGRQIELAEDLEQTDPVGVGLVDGERLVAAHPPTLSGRRARVKRIG